MGHGSGLVERRGENSPRRGNNLFKGKSQVKSYQVYNESKTNGLTGEEETKLEKKARAPGKGEVGRGAMGLHVTRAEDLGRINEALRRDFEALLGP